MIYTWLRTGPVPAGHWCRVEWNTDDGLMSLFDVDGRLLYPPYAVSIEQISSWEKRAASFVTECTGTFIDAGL